MKRESDRKSVNQARVHASAQSFDRCEVQIALQSYIKTKLNYGVVSRSSFLCWRSCQYDKLKLGLDCKCDFESVFSLENMSKLL